MNDNLFAFIVGFLLGAISLCLFMRVLTLNQKENEAVRQGHAEYYLDEDFNRQWRWKTNCSH